jgi:hypothetical protein
LRELSSFINNHFSANQSVFGSLCGSVFSLVVVAENALYTTTTSRFGSRLLFGVCVGVGLQTGCSVIRKQNSGFFDY